MSKDETIKELLKEVRNDVKEHREDSLKQHYETAKRLDIYNEQLQVHIEGVNTLKQLHQDNVKRIEDLEKPSNSWKYIGGLILKGGALAGAIAAIIKLISTL